MKLAIVCASVMVVCACAVDAVASVRTAPRAQVPVLTEKDARTFAFLSGGQQIPVDITIRPMTGVAGGTSQIRMNADLPVDGATIHGPVTIAGWALDPQAWTGAGIGAVHVWAFRVDAPSTGPQFLGTATVGLPRPDVANAFGAQFGNAGFSLTTTALAPGEYDIVAYAWCDRTQRFEDARTVRVIVR